MSVIKVNAAKKGLSRPQTPETIATPPYLAGPTFALPQHAKTPHISPERIAKRQATAAPAPERPSIACKLFFIQMLLFLLVVPLAEWVRHKPVTISNHCAARKSERLMPERRLVPKCWSGSKVPSTGRYSPLK
jgi:hypothetical protein